MKNNLLNRTLKLVAALGLALGFMCPPAYAEDAPFQLDSGQWMSFDHYKDADKRGLITQAPPKSEAPAPAIEATADQAQTKPAPSSTVPVVAAPTRPLNLPVMPGFNKGFTVRVYSTEDDKPAIVIPDSASTKAPDIHLSDENWQSPEVVVGAKKSEDDSDADVPLNIRMSYLPDRNIAPIPSPEHESSLKAARLTLEKMIADKNRPKDKDKAKTPEEAAACAALDAYKKQQLTAIQSDRQTLKALQEAISSLGLQKDLGFMTGDNSALNAQHAQTLPDIDLPAAPTLR